MTHSVFHWLRGASTPQRAARTRRISRPRRSFVPQLLALEDRTVLSVLTVLNNADSGAGSLRDTVAAAQNGDTIVFDPSMADETITLTSGPLALSSNLTIDGPGANLLAISGNNASQIFTLSGSAQLTLANLTLTAGISSQGGAVSIGGTAALTLDSDILSGNQAVGDASGNALGGAVYNSAGASLTIDSTVFLNNQAKGTNSSFGGGIANAGTLSVNSSTFTGNAAQGSTTVIGSPAGGNQGGAIGNLDGSTSTITLSTFTGNQALGTGVGDAEGGAICNEYVPIFPFTGSGITITVSQCTFANNVAKGGSNAGSSALAADGGGGGAIGDEPGTNLTVLNCTFTGNQANSGGGNQAEGEAEGGAIRNGVAATATISNSQFISNSAIGTGVGALAAGGALSNAATAMISNCLFIGNSAVGGPMADGVNTFGQAEGGAIDMGTSLVNHGPEIFTLSNSIVAGNEALGGSGGSIVANAFTDAAFGGGIFNLLGGTLNVVGCTITGNQAIGGTPANGNGGFALGGGIDNFNQSTLNLRDSTVSRNLCQGGQGPSGSAGGGALGGGIDNYRSSLAILTNSTLSLNESRGGAGGAGANGGEAVGGSVSNAARTYFFGTPDTSSLIVSNCQIIGNVAQGGTQGSSAVGGDGLGGGLFVGSGTARLQAVLVSGNQAQGGTDGNGNTTGQGLGGGVYIDPSASASADMETFMAGNQASKSNNDVWGTITIVP
jgi:hypothetical protein